MSDFRAWLIDDTRRQHVFARAGQESVIIGARDDDEVFATSVDNLWLAHDRALLSVNLPSVPDSSDFDGRGCLHENRAPVTDPQPSTWPPD
jgi:hypothetical protein